jgi:pimeloyl-ACP methyl ester carboxylesterase
VDARQERRWTVGSRGAELAVFQYGQEPGPDVPTMLLVHGYPDDHRVWLPLVSELPATTCVLAYDTRNAGSSVVTEQPGIFSLTVLVDDLFAVLASAGASDVQLVGHDWGSIQGWAAIQDPRAVDAIGRFTSISGPDLRHVGRWLRSRARNPGTWPQLAGQLLRSLYVPAFLLPGLPEAAWRLGLTRQYERRARRPIGDNPIRGLALYRSNVRWLRRRTRPPGPGGAPTGTAAGAPAAPPPPPPSGTAARRSPVAVPVQVVVPTRDPFVSPHLVDGLKSWVTDLAITRVHGGHWWPESHPAELAQLLQADAGGLTSGK